MATNPEIRFDFFSMINKSQKARNLLWDFEENSELILFGGTIRDYFDNQFINLPRDIDIVLKDKNSIWIEKELNKFGINYKRNKFGGFKAFIDEFTFDFWALKDTWAFKEHKIECSVKNLPETVFLNIDGLVYNLTTQDLMKEFYDNGMKTRCIDIVFSDNPFPELNIMRAYNLKDKYTMEFSSKLQNYIQEWFQDQPSYINGLEKLKKIEQKRYGENKIYWEKEIDELKANVPLYL